MRKQYFRKRQWLNPVSSCDDGWLKASITTATDTPTYREIEADLVIADCSRTIALDFSTYKPSKRKLQARKKKLRKLIEFLEEFEYYYNEASKEMEK